MSSLETQLEGLIFRSRWLLAPFFVGLLIGVGALLFKFGKELFHMLEHLMVSSSQDSILSILTLVDTALLASLLLIIAFSGYENFVSKLNIGDHEDRPAWMGKVGFSDLKLKLIGAIVAISAVELLKAFINADQLGDNTLFWRVVIHITFVTSGVLFALTDYINEKARCLEARCLE